jgi:cell pole-organizing protein PopZ
VAANMIRVPNGIDSPGAIDASIASMVRVEPIDAESLEDVAALVDVLEDEKSELAAVFVGAQATPAAGESSKEVHDELTELTRVINVLIGKQSHTRRKTSSSLTLDHAETLHKEDIGEIAPVDISHLVLEAIRQGEAYISDNAFSRGFEGIRKNARDRRDVAREAKTINHMTDDQRLADYFKLAVQNAEQARADGAEGTAFLMRARHALREIRKRKTISRNPAILELTTRFTKLERGQSVARSIKRATLKRERDQAKTAAREAAQRGDGKPFVLDSK